MSSAKATGLAVLIVAIGMIASVRFGNASPFFDDQVINMPVYGGSPASAQPA